MAKTYSCVLVGVDVRMIEIETVLGNGFSGLTVIGVPSELSRDMKERVRSALEAVGVAIPARRVVVNIGPREAIRLTRTNLATLDFAVAACVLKALCGQKKNDENEEILEFFGGELSLSGGLKPLTDRLLYHAVSSLQKNSAIALPPSKDIHALDKTNQFVLYSHLQEWFDWKFQKKGQTRSLPVPVEEPIVAPAVLRQELFNRVKGTLGCLLKNPKACVAAAVTVAGRHNILLAGEPGVGKSFTIAQLVQLQLPLSEAQRIDVQLIHSQAALAMPPLRSPHHSCSSAALVGGASLRPGEVTLAHHGILFLDELAEFSRSTLEAMREPLDSKRVFLSRANGNVEYPADFQLCATTNPCPCGYFFSKKRACRCLPRESQKYLQKMSGPLLERFCLQVWLPPLSETRTMPDIFAEYLWEKRSHLDPFIERFLAVQEMQREQAFQEPELVSEPEVTSLRAFHKMHQIKRTFALLFPELETHARFEFHVSRYRCLSQLFLKFSTGENSWLGSDVAAWF